MKSRRIQALFLLVCMFSTLWYTVLCRYPSFHVAQLELFWSYRKWFSGDWGLGKEILGNIAMFVPFGFLLAAAISKRGREGLWILASALLFSSIIEILQLVLMRGLFEWDDILNNAAGALLGWGTFRVIEARFSKRNTSIIFLALSSIFVIVCAGTFIVAPGKAQGEEGNTPADYCFQIDRASVEDGVIRLSGFAFVYEQRQDRIAIVLKSLNRGESVSLNTEYGLERSDINDYFLCEYDYSHVGFLATGEIEADEEYEVMIRFPWSVPVSTGVYITGDRVHYAKDDEFVEPVGLDEITKNGVLRVFRRDFHCWVYQLGSDLYWIVDEDFDFEEDNSTYIQYQLWTTQTENLPEKRLANGNLWDNIGGYFEDYELKSDCGPYRVMKRKLPEEYAITSIITGYYTNEEWVWKSFFRPIYGICHDSGTVHAFAGPISGT